MLNPFARPLACRLARFPPCRSQGFHPEGFNLASMSVQAGQKGYPLRPEHIESIFYAHRTVGGDEWLEAGQDVLNSLERLRVPCGYAAVSDIVNGTLEDKMESFYLSETLKYLYLLFDPDDAVYTHGRHATLQPPTPSPLATACRPPPHLTRAVPHASSWPQVRLHD